MNKSTHVILSTITTASLLVLAGCTTQTITNSNVTANTNTVANTNTINTNTNAVVTNVNNNTNNVTASDNTNTGQESEVNTTDWQSYTSEVYSFTLNYPSTWLVEETSYNCLGLTSPKRAKENTEFEKKFDDPNFGTDAYFPYDLTICQDDAEGLSLQDWIDANVEEMETLSSETLLVGGKQAWQLVIDNLGIWRRTFVLVDDKITTIYSANADNSFTKLRTLNAIIASIQFLEVSAESWETYINTERGFSVSYPEEWRVETGRDEDNEPTLDDTSKGFFITYDLPAWKHQDFTPGVSIVFETNESFTELKKKLEKNNQGSTKTKIDGYNATIYNQLEVVYEQITLIPKKNIVVRASVDENYLLGGIFEGVYNSIQLD